MSSIKRDNRFLIFTILGFLVLQTSLLAQARQGGRMPDSTQIAAQIDSLAKKLSLSDSVKTKVADIYASSYQSMAKVFEQNRGDFRAMRDVRKKATQKRDEEVKALLSDKQKKEYDKIVEEEMRQRRKLMRRRRQF